VLIQPVSDPSSFKSTGLIKHHPLDFQSRVLKCHKVVVFCWSVSVWGGVPQGTGMGPLTF